MRQRRHNGDGDDSSALDAAADMTPSTAPAPTSTRDPDAPPAWQASTLPPEPPEFWEELDEMWESQREMRLEETRQAQREADRQAEWEAMDWDEQSGCHVEDFRCVEAWHAATTTTTTAPPPTTRRPAPSTTKPPPPTTARPHTHGTSEHASDDPVWDEETGSYFPQCAHLEGDDALVCIHADDPIGLQHARMAREQMKSHMESGGFVEPECSNVSCFE